MLVIHKKIFNEMCNNNISLYEDFIKTIKNEYSVVIKNILNSVDCVVIRYETHKLISIIAILDGGITSEIKYICSLILSLDKGETDFIHYKPYIDMLKNIDNLYMI
jgi:hypothetical protein